MASILADSCSIYLPGAVSDAKTENPNKNDDLEIFSQIEVDEHFLDFCDLAQKYGMSVLVGVVTG